MTLLFRIICVACLCLSLTLPAFAVPTQYGDTGLISQPTADTLNSGNICVGLWTNYTDSPNGTSRMVPLSITLGLGSFLEMYGSYPSIYFNDEEQKSGRGYLDLGAKIRVFGGRSSLFKVALDGQLQRQISYDPAINRLVDYQGRLITSFKTRQFGVHAYGAYRSKDDRPVTATTTYEDSQVGFGAGIEFFPTERLRLIAEGESYSRELVGGDRQGEVGGGIQYFLSPHMTLSVGGTIGLTDASPDYRILVGLSTCQGIGTYSPIKELAALPEEELEPETKEPVKLIRIKTLSPMNPMPPVTATPAATALLPDLSGADEAVDIQPATDMALTAPAASAAFLPVIIAKQSDEEALPAVTLFEAKAKDLEVVVATNTTEFTISPAESLVTPGIVPVASPAFPDPPAPIALVGQADPVISEPTQVALYRKFVLPEFTFAFADYHLSEEGKNILSQIANELKQDDKWFAVRIDGYTDATGPSRYNERLSFQRAMDYAVYLANHEGVDPRRIFVKGFGESTPIATNETPDGRAMNRRVELLLLTKPVKPL